MDKKISASHLATRGDAHSPKRSPTGRTTSDNRSTLCYDVVARGIVAVK